ncbi:hypothetical protein F4778DRAFT_745147 [Xylariomycetidae sp. FL2044]|nr:hypothetical protein F4778DRAFT_745147 [Xylariomycetidae sp. FL2044]
MRDIGWFALPPIDISTSPVLRPLGLIFIFYPSLSCTVLLSLFFRCDVRSKIRDPAQSIPAPRLLSAISGSWSLLAANILYATLSVLAK